MSLIKILDNIGIDFSDTFKKDILKKEEQPNKRWALILLNDDKIFLESVVSLLVKVVNIPDYIAKTIVLMAHYKGKSIIKIGDGNDILELAGKLNKFGIKTVIGDMNNLK